MLLRFDRFSDLDPRKLMDIYAESNLDNTAYFYPEITDKAEAVRRMEERFLEYLDQNFFHTPGPSLWVLEVDGRWVSALRLNELKPGFYYLEALETSPDCRRRGYSSRLLTELIETLKQRGPFELHDCVGKKNKASLRTHLKCGFQIVAEDGCDYLSQETSVFVHGLAYSYEEKQ